VEFILPRNFNRVPYQWHSSLETLDYKTLPSHVELHEENLLEHDNKMCDSWTSLPHADQVGQLATLGLHLNEPEAVIICSTCEYALQPKGDRVSRHIGEIHKVPKTVRRGLVAFVQSLRLVDPDTLDLREDGSFPHPHLRIMEGFGCKACKFRSRSLDILCRHASKEHKSHHSPNNEWVVGDYIETSLKLQSWTQVGKRGFWKICDSQTSSPDAYDNLGEDLGSSPCATRHQCNPHGSESRVAADFSNPATSQSARRIPPNSLPTQPQVLTVGVERVGLERRRLDNPNSSHPISEARQKRVEELLLAEQQHINNEKGSNCLPENDNWGDSALHRPWLQRTGWVSLFQHTRRDILINLTQSPQRLANTALPLGSYNGVNLTSSSEDEAKLRQVSNAIDLFFGRCEETVTYTDFSILRWMQSYQADHPFKSRSNSLG